MANIKVQRTGARDYGRYIKALICGSPGAGKALAADTPIPTDEGWKKIINLVPGDQVVSEEGKWIEVTGVFPQGIRDLYRVSFSDGTSIDCDLDHLWQVEQRRGRNRKLRQTQVLTLGQILDVGVKASDGGKNFFIPVIEPVHYSEKYLPVDPYTLGCLLGDSSFRTESLMFSTADPEIFAAMDLNGMVPRHTSGYDYIISEKPGGSRLDRYNIIKAELEYFGLWGLKSQDKFIPDAYLVGSIEQRQELVRGLMDTDGTVRASDRSGSFGSTSRLLVEQFAEVLYSLGCVTGRYSKGVCVKHTDRLDYYRVNVGTWFNPFKLLRKATLWTDSKPLPSYRAISSVEPIGAGEAVCIKVDSTSGLFAAKDYIVTHNTLISSTFPNPIYASAEGGLMSIADRNIPYVKVESSHDLLAIKHAVDQVSSVREELLGFPVDTVVIDTIDEVQRILIRERLEETKKDAMSLPDWGWLGEQMQAIIRGFRNLDLNVVFTCHTKEVQDNDSGRVWFEPGLQGAISKQISAYVDLALLLRSQNRTKVINNTATQVQERMLITRPDIAHEWVKDRSGKLPVEVEVNFVDDYDRLADLIFGKIDLLPDNEEVEVTAPQLAPAQNESTVVNDFSPAEDTPPETVVSVPPAVPATGRTVPVLPTSETVVDVPAPLLSAKSNARVCDECGVEVGADQADLSKIRFRKVLCREHHASMKRTK